MSITVGSLKKLLNHFDDDLQIVCKPSQGVGDTGAVYYIYENEVQQFGESTRYVVLSCSIPPKIALEK